jgi:transposase InsO family protein
LEHTVITIGIDPHKGSHTATAVDEHEAVVGELRVNAGGCRPPSARDRADAELVGVIKAIHGRSRGTYGAPRIHAELAMAFATRCGRKRVARLMRSAAIEGVHRRRRGGLTIRDPNATPPAEASGRPISSRSHGQASMPRPP